MLDPSAEEDWDDAARDLGRYDEPEAEEALIKKATDLSIDDDLADVCGESLAEIWCRRGVIDQEILARLHPVAREIATGTIQALCPDLLQRG